MRESIPTSSSRGLIRLTQILCFAAAASTIVSFWDGLAMPRLYAAEAVVTTITAWGIGQFLTRRDAAARNRFSRLETSAILALAAVPLAGEGVARMLGWGLPAEILLVTSLRNAMLMLAFLPHVRAAPPAAAVSSLALTAMSFLVLWKWQVAVITGVYCFVGVWWLVGYSWDRLRAFRGEEQALSIPWRATSIVVAIVAGLAAAGGLVATRTSVAGTPAEFFPSSGGTTWSDSRAWGGVHDGEQAVGAQDDAMSFAPVETDLFLESEEPSLYDMFNDMYQEAATKKDKKQHRAISLGPMPTLQEHVHRTKSEGPSREFDAVREKASTPRKVPPATSSRAVLHFVGRTPAHLRLETFNAWDGRALTYRAEFDAAAVDTPTLSVDSTGEKPWLVWDSPTSTIESNSAWRERSGARIVRLATNRAPTPEGTRRLHLAKLNAPDLFVWAEPSQLRLDQAANVPQFTIFEFDAALHDVSAYAVRNDAPPAPARAPDAVATPRIAGLAEEWSDGAAPGWNEVRRLIGRLNDACEHSPEVVVPPGVDDAAEHFLFRSQAGPDYLFATSAALLLRARGYDVRVASGLYARPENYDAASECTLVMPEDVHFWTEIRTVEGDWVVLEPTPGYERLAPPRSLAQWAYQLFSSTLEFVLRWPFATVALLIGLPLVWILRRDALLMLHLVLWGARPFASPPSRLIATRKLAERIGALAGRPRGSSRTLRSWLDDFASDWPIDARWDVDAWLALHHASAFSSRGVTTAEPSDVDALGRRLIANALRSLIRARRESWAARFRRVASYIGRTAAPLPSDA